jgi:hypothetical protein
MFVDCTSDLGTDVNLSNVISDSSLLVSVPSSVFIIIKACIIIQWNYFSLQKFIQIDTCVKLVFAVNRIHYKFLTYNTPCGRNLWRHRPVVRRQWCNRGCQMMAVWSNEGVGDDIGCRNMHGGPGVYQKGVALARGRMPGWVACATGCFWEVSDNELWHNRWYQTIGRVICL